MRSIRSVLASAVGMMLLAATVTMPAAAQSSGEADSPDTTATDTTATVTMGAPVEMDELVVTATKTYTTPEDLSVPVSVLTGEIIDRQGVTRLSDLLAIQPGLTLNYDHGAGLQIQGLGADYTLILIDGQRIVGRTAGTLNLDRVSVRGIERVEVVRGPSSSLYGSEALAGVVNIITKTPDANLGAEVRTRYGTHGTSDVALHAETGGKTQASMTMQRYASAGYDLVPETVSPTVPSFSDYTARASVRRDLSNSTHLQLRGRATHEQQNSRVEVRGETALFDESAERTDWSLTPQFTYTVRPGTKLTGSVHASGYHTRRNLQQTDASATLEESGYNQLFTKADIEGTTTLGRRHLLTAGTGFIHESVDADRVVGDRSGAFVFVQDEWTPTERLKVVPGARLDIHTDYASRLSPRLSSLYRLSDAVRLRASVGSGYKAPAFRQLYLNFTNARVGYTVLGAEYVRSELAEIEENGQIQSFLRDPSGLGSALEAERSVAFNVGATVQPVDAVSAKVNLFHNEIDNLIDTQPVATKTNGQQVFTYFNRGSVYTRGIEAQTTLQPTPALQATLSYTFLQARDRNVLQDLEAGRIYRRDASGRDVRVTKSDYGGLTGRSRHTATVQFAYEINPIGLTASVQGRYRGRYGFADLNGNGIVDTEAEYAPAHGTLDAVLTKTVFQDHAVVIGVNNATDHRDATHTPHLSGREWFAELKLSF